MRTIESVDRELSVLATKSIVRLDRLEQSRLRVEAARRQVSLDEEALDLLRSCQLEDDKLLDFIESVESAGLSQIYETDVRFILERSVNERTNVKSVVPKISEGGMPRVSLGEASAEGIAVTASILLRFVLFAINKKTTRFVCMDEPAPELDSIRYQRLMGVLDDLSRKLGLRYLIATHSPSPEGTVYRVTCPKHDSTVRKVEQ